jgi:hypothetical protein
MLRYADRIASIVYETVLSQNGTNVRRLARIRPDVVHSQEAGHHGILAKHTGYPTVDSIHGILSQEVELHQDFEHRMRARLQGWMEDDNCIRRASHAILIS